jgi:hypothetical protein
MADAISHINWSPFTPWRKVTGVLLLKTTNPIELIPSPFHAGARISGWQMILHIQTGVSLHCWRKVTGVPLVKTTNPIDNITIPCRS